MNRNPGLFSPSGFIDGRTMILNLLKVGAMYLGLGLVLLGVYLVIGGLSIPSLWNFHGENSLFSLSLGSILLATSFSIFTPILVFTLGAAYLCFINLFKRVRDVRGKTTNEFEWKIALFILMTSGGFLLPLVVAYLTVARGRYSEIQEKKNTGAQDVSE